MKGKRHAPWPKRRDAEQECIRALKWVAKCIRLKTRGGTLIVTSTDCYCMGDGECCWCVMKNALKELRYSQ